MPEPTPPDGSSNICSAKRSEWSLIGRGKHSLVFDCGDGWVWKESRHPEQAEIVDALARIKTCIPEGLAVHVPAMHAGDGGFFQTRIDGIHPDDRTSMRVAWAINRQAALSGIYFRDLIPENLLRDDGGQIWVLDCLCVSRR